MASYKITKCLCCNSENLDLVLDLAMQPLANTYRRIQDINVEKYPLALNVCLNCWHSQLSYCVDRKLIFDSYTYISGTSKTLNSYFRWFSQELKKIISRDGRVLEIAANDGSLVIENLGQLNIAYNFKLPTRKGGTLHKDWMGRFKPAYIAELTAFVNSLQKRKLDKNFATVEDGLAASIACGLGVKKL